MEHPFNAELADVVEFESQPAEGFALVQSRQARTRGKAKLGPEDRKAHAMAVITLDLERGGPAQVSW